jgi:DNA primase
VSLSPLFLDELRARTTLSTVIGRSIKVTKAGREFKACCPFHGEKTPSFTVNDDKGFYHCFGCGAHGDVFTWHVNHGGMAFIDAVRDVAAAAGMDVPAPSPEAAQRAAQIDGVRPALSAAASYYQQQLDQSGAVMEYLVGERALTRETIAKFGMGYAPPRYGQLADVLGRTDAAADLAIEAGLCFRSDEGRAVERFVRRIMVPINDARGQICGFGARIFGSGEPKYLNSPDGVMFDKGRLLFNLHRAAPAARTAKRLIVVEGYMDVIGCDQVGVSECVAPMGTALTERQLMLLWRVHHRPVLMFDGDTAGQKAAVRACEAALPFVGPGHELSICVLPGGDPDDLRKQGGRDAIEEALSGAVSVEAFLFEAVCREMVAA